MTTDLDEEALQIFPDRERSVKRPERVVPEMPSEVVDLYSSLASFLRAFKTGELPDALCILAQPKKLRNWLDPLFLTKPMTWSGGALLAMTNLFVRGPPGRLATFMSDVVLVYAMHRVECRLKIQGSVFTAITNASHKPQPFVTGFLMPLISAPDLTGREAKFISRVLAITKLPPDHASVFVTRVVSNAQPNVKTLVLARVLSRGYPLAVVAIDAIVAHFLAVEDNPPLIWHRALGDLVHRYHTALTDEQRDAIIDLAKRHRHEAITDQLVEALLAR